MVSVVMHYNPSLPHQVKHAQAFAAAGVEAIPTPQGEADIHIVSGPHFALDRWKHHPRVIWLDRAFYDDPEYVSMGWLNPDGSRTFAIDTPPRHKPELMPWKTRECSALVLADYKQDVTETTLAAKSRFGYASVRKHPAETAPKLSLKSQLMLHDVCIGHSSTALFEAVVMGVPVICTDHKNIMAEVSAHSIEADLYRGDREDWLHRVSYMQWNHDEFGQALDYLNAYSH